MVACPVEVTSGAAVPVIAVVTTGAVTVGIGSRVGGVGTPLNVGVPGTENVVAGVTVVPLKVDVVDVVTVAGVTDDVVITLFVLNCAATGRDVNVSPTKASARTPIGTFELINNNPVTACVKLGSPRNSSVTNCDIC